MTDQPNAIILPENLDTEPNAIQRTQAFMEQRLIPVDENDSGEKQVDPFGALATRSDRIGQYRNRHVRHNPLFPVFPAGAGADPNAEPIEGGFLIEDQRVPDLLLSGHFYPIGPTVQLGAQKRDQLEPMETVSGRITSLEMAMADNNLRIYAGAANGGVWRSDDAGKNWRPLMNGVHMAPTTTGSDSLAIGAIAIDPADPDRIFVGTGEGPGRVTIGGAPEFFGIGPIVSQDGGFSWTQESVVDNVYSGSAFFEMILDPVDKEKVTAATRHGVIQRRPRNFELNQNFKPQAYFFRHGDKDGSFSTYYWQQNGTTVARAFPSGSGNFKGMILTPFEWRGIPYYLEYNPREGQPLVSRIEGDGSSTLLSSEIDRWGEGLTDFMPVTLMGKLHMLAYNQTSGLASLRSFEVDETSSNVMWQVVWENRNWQSGWTNFIPVNISGHAFFLVYDLVSGTATLQRWHPNGEYVRVWKDRWPPGLRIMAFNYKASAYFLVTHSTDGSGSLHQWRSDGSYNELTDHPNDTFRKSINLQLLPYVSQGRPYFLAYDYDSGSKNTFRWNPTNWTLENLDNEVWPRNIIVKGFNMGFEWSTLTFQPSPGVAAKLKKPEVPTASGLAVTRAADVTHYYAAFWDDTVYRSTDGGAKWSVLAKGFPEKAGRITLASQYGNQKVLYAFTQKGKVYYWADGFSWIEISGVPKRNNLVGKQGSYDLAIAVSPVDTNTIILGGSLEEDLNSALYRCKVTPSLGMFNITSLASMVPTLIGQSVHPDIHVIKYQAQNNADELWIGCDGGVFYSANATSVEADDFETLFMAKNCGLATQTVNYIAQHPTEEAILYCGTQDNGGQIFTGSETWRTVSFGDAGAVVVKNNEPEKLIISANSDLYWLGVNDGNMPGDNAGIRISNLDPKNTIFYPPVVGTMGLGNNQGLVALGSNKVLLSENFGANKDDWTPISASLGEKKNTFIKSLVFLTPTRLILGTMDGKVFRVEKSNFTFEWQMVRLDEVNNGQSLTPKGPITSIAWDPDNDDRKKFYVTIGGNVETYQRVWYYDDEKWAARSGPGANHSNALLDVTFNAIAAAKINNVVHLFAGADIGIWHSQDGGNNWRPFSIGLPETAVFDLKIFPGNANSNRPWLLRAATYGRSVFERVIFGGQPNLATSLTRPVQLYIQTNQLDRGLYPARNRQVDGVPNLSMNLRLSVDMKMLKRENDGVFAAPANLNFCEFELLLPENIRNKKPVQGRFYVRIHTRGLATADNVNVRLLMTKVNDTAVDLENANPIEDLPIGLPAKVRSSEAIDANEAWLDLGTTNAEDLFAGTPRVVISEFELTQKGSYFVVAILNHVQDPFVDLERNVTTLITNNRKAALSYFTVDF